MFKEVKIESRIENLRIVEKAIDDFSNEIGIEQNNYGKILVSIMEAVNNAIIHGNKYMNEFLVRVLIEIFTNEILVEVEDKGEGFDVNSIPSPVEEGAIQKEGGRGIYFIKHLSLSCYTIGRGNIIRIKLKR